MDKLVKLFLIEQKEYSLFHNKIFNLALGNTAVFITYINNPVILLLIEEKILVR